MVRHCAGGGGVIRGGGGVSPHHGSPGEPQEGHPQDGHDDAGHWSLLSTCTRDAVPDQIWPWLHWAKVKELRREIEKGWMDRIGGIQGIQGGHLHLRQHFLDWVWCCACAVAVQCYKVMQLVTGMVLHTAPTLPGSTLNPQPTTLRTQVLIPEYTTSKIIFYQKFTKQYGITMVLMA